MRQDAERKQYTHFESYTRAAMRIKKKTDRCDFYDSIGNYALYGIEPDLDSLPDSVAMAFELIKPTLDSSKRKSENGKKGGKNNKQTESKTEANDKQTESEKEIEEDKDKDKDKEIENECYIHNAPRGGAKRNFSPPSVEDVRAYCLERHNGINPEAFVSFYDSKGWMIGKNKMKDWKAAVRTWETNRRDKTNNTEKPVTNNPFLRRLMELENNEQS